MTTETDTESEVVRAKISFRAGAAMVKKGDLFESDSDVVVGREHLFTSVAGTVRTTSTVPGPVTSPPPFLDDDDDEDDDEDDQDDDDQDDDDEDDDDGPERPADGASKASWQAYLVELGHEGDTGGLKRAELIVLADELEAG